MPSTAGTEPACRRILVVEDEYFLADDTTRTLETLGAHVVGPASTLARAFDLLAEEPVDPLADALRDQGVPFVFATGYDGSVVPDACRDAPRWQEPFEPEDLVGALPAIVQNFAAFVAGSCRTRLSGMTCGGSGPGRR